MPAMAPPERRELLRHPVRAFAQVLYASQGWNVQLLDMSFNGARLSIEHDLPVQAGDEINLTVELEDVDQPEVSAVLEQQPRKLLRLRGTLVYRNDAIAGVEYRPISEVDQALLTLMLARPDY